MLSLSHAKAHAISISSTWGRIPDSNSLAARYSLHICQQPRAARAGPDSKDCQPINPPPVLQLMLTDSDTDLQAVVNELRSPFVVNCRLESATSPRRELSTITTCSYDGSCEIQRVLLGTSVASSFHTKDNPDSNPTSQP